MSYFFSLNILIPLSRIQLGQRLVHWMPGWVMLLSGVTALACSILSLCWENGVFLTPHIPFSLCCQQAVCSASTASTFPEIFLQ